MRVKNSSSIIMRIAVILLCLVLFSAHLASGMFARYTTSVQAKDGARIANLGVTISDVSQTSITDDGQYTTFSCTVDNTSEVAFAYDVVVSLDDNGSFDPSDYLNAITLTGFTGTSETSSDGKTVTFKNAGYIEPSTSQTTLEFVIDVSHVIVRFNQVYANGNWGPTVRKFPLYVTLKVNQVD